MKKVTVEVEVQLPDGVTDAAVSQGIDHMLDAGEAVMVDKVFECACAQEIDPAIAHNCIDLNIADSTVVESLEHQPEPDEPPRKLIHLTALDEYLNPPFKVVEPAGGFHQMPGV